MACNRFFHSSALTACCFLFLGCASFMSNSADNFTKAVMKQADPKLVRDGAPAYLLLMVGLIEGNPKSAKLLLAGAQLYGAYNSAFVAVREPERALILSAKAKDYAIRALSMRNKDFAQVHDKPFSRFAECLPTFTKKDVPALFLVISAWAAWIQARSDNWDAVADVAKIQGMNERLLQLDETYYYGSPHIVMGVLCTLLPPGLGGRPQEAKKHFEKAIEIGKGRFLQAYVLYAKQYARMMNDRELYDRLLKTALSTPADVEPELTLINTLAKEDAAKLLAEADGFF